MPDFIMPKRRRTTALEMAAWAAKTLFLAIGVASTAVVAARFAFPYLLDLLSSLPRLRSSFVSWLAPPYLFIAVHFIIMVVWKLHGNPREDHDNSSISSAIHDTVSSATTPANLDAPVSFSDINSGISSTVHDTVSTATTAANLHVAVSFTDHPLDSQAEIHAIARKAAENGSSTTEQGPWPPPAEAEPDDIREDALDYLPSSSPDGIDATWKAIMNSKSSPDDKRQLMKKSDTWEKTSRSPAAKAATATPPPILTRADNKEFKKSVTFKETTSTTTASVSEDKHDLKKEMRKWRTFRESAAGVVGWRGRDVLAVGHDELFRKVEAFIKMNYDQMRLQRQESQQQQQQQHYVAAN